MASSREAPHRIGMRSGKAKLIVIVAGMVACAGEDTPDSASTSDRAASQASQSSAVMDLGGETYTFERASCDLDDSIDDDVLARASGTAPDGRRMSLEVERREVGELPHDRVTIYFGAMVDGDHWNAYANQTPAGTWITQNGGVPLDGPLVVIEGATLTAEGTFEHETRDETRTGSFRLSCGG